MIKKHPLVIAHRGASIDREENTLEAFAEARVQGADWVELDVRRSADGVLVVHHDAYLPDGRLVRETLTGDLPESVPNLAEAFEACEGMGVNLEIKNLPGEPDFEEIDLVCEAVVGLTVAYRPYNQLLISSFDIHAIDRVRTADSDLATGWLVSERNDIGQILGRVEAHGHSSINLWDELVDEAFIVEAHRRDLRIFVWTVDDVARIGELSTWGVDGIITNVPALARQAVSAD
tara:strand:+ start:800 stop:1498 length:699 start_codon:yes stop_codon:yes gene_type:complete